MRRREINRLRAAGKIPPIDAAGRQRWEREQKLPAEALNTAEIWDAESERKLARENAEQKLLEAQLDELEGVIQHGSRQVADLAAAEPSMLPPRSAKISSAKTCPYCGRVCKHPQALKWHLRGCKSAPRPAA